MSTFFFGTAGSDSLEPDLAIEVPLVIRDPIDFDTSTSAAELSNRDGTIALYEAEVRAAGSVTRIPRPPAYLHPLEAHALRAWRRLYKRKLETTNQRRRRDLKRKRDSAATSRSPLDSFLQYDSNAHAGTLH